MTAPNKQDHSCSVPGCGVLQAPFGVERIVLDADGWRRHGVDRLWFCGAHLAERDDYSARLNGPPADDDRVEQPSRPLRPTRVPELAQGRLL